ncbi:MAG: rRNA maturation RNase YbeY [Betaproteobacteria bacterium]|nr:rRNA maturation RNase YbeY [Betaproteobacteria bacterium]
MSAAHKLSPYKLSLVVQYATSAKNLPARSQFRRWIKAALERDVQIALRIVDESEGRELNRNFRGKDYATNVLTFVYDDELPIYGDLVICAPIVEKEARGQHKDLFAHYAHLAIHAALHLQGYDHDNNADAAAMEEKETAILLKLGYADPYQEVVSKP